MGSTHDKRCYTLNSSVYLKHFSGNKREALWVFWCVKIHVYVTDDEITQYNTFKTLQILTFAWNKIPNSHISPIKHGDTGLKPYVTAQRVHTVSTGSFSSRGGFCSGISADKHKSESGFVRLWSAGSRPSTTLWNHLILLDLINPRGNDWVLVIFKQDWSGVKHSNIRLWWVHNILLEVGSGSVLPPRWDSWVQQVCLYM